MLSEKIRAHLCSAKSGAARFCAQTSGAAAVEFAFIAPLLITMYLGTMEISQGIEINKKVGRSASLIADIVAQDTEMTISEIEDVIQIGAAVLQPYNRDIPTITVSGISIDADGDATVVWSRKGTEGGYSAGDVPGSATVVPANLNINDTFLVKVETSLEYLPITSWSIEKNKSGPGGAYASVPMKETYYLRPRQGDDVKCTDCPTS